MTRAHARARGVGEDQTGEAEEVICRLMIDLMRDVHGAYAPKSEPFGTRIEAFVHFGHSNRLTVSVMTNKSPPVE
jgi:hypothetical protein